jgi:hypothetical protein
MDIKISTGQWIHHMVGAIMHAADGDCFLLPSDAHLHAYEIAKTTTKTEKHLKVKIQQ